MGPTIPIMPASYTITYPSTDSSSFPADFVYSGVSCGAPETSYVVTSIPTGPSLTFLVIQTTPVHVIGLSGSTYTGLPGVFKFTLQASGAINPLLQNTEFSFTV